MRVIAGEKRGLKLTSPKGDLVRPTADKVRGAIFNTLQNRVPGAVFVDLFGGSGAMSVEAVSRGAREAWVFDIAGASLKTIRDNVTRAGFEDRIAIRKKSADKAAEFLENRGVTCDILFLDPPYAEVPRHVESALAFIQKKIIANDGIILIEHEKSVIMPVALSDFVITKTKGYGITQITYYEKER